MGRLTAIVLGGSQGAWGELADARALAPDAILVACNHAARDVEGPLDHWATMHPELLPKWMGERRAAGRPAAGRLWHALHRPSCEGSTGIENWGGSSGLLCVRVAIEVGAERIILAGVPMLKNERHYDNPKQWIEARQYWGAWERRRGKLLGRVKSLSGWTRELLGAPTREWLDDGA